MRSSVLRRTRWRSDLGPQGLSAKSSGGSCPREGRRVEVATVATLTYVGGLKTREHELRLTGAPRPSRVIRNHLRARAGAARSFGNGSEKPPGSRGNRHAHGCVRHVQNRGFASKIAIATVPEDCLPCRRS